MHIYPINILNGIYHIFIFLYSLAGTGFQLGDIHTGQMLMLLVGASPQPIDRYLLKPCIVITMHLFALCHSVTQNILQCFPMALHLHTVPSIFEGLSSCCLNMFQSPQSPLIVEYIYVQIYSLLHSHCLNSAEEIYSHLFRTTKLSHFFKVHTLNQMDRHDFGAPAV